MPWIAFLPAILFCAIAGISRAFAEDRPADQQWLVFEGKDGPGKGKHAVFIAGANEYDPDLGLPPLARILAERHGFTCTVLYSINRKTGFIDPDTGDNIPGLEALDHADLMVILARFRTLPDEQMKHVVDYLEAGKPVIGLRTATHSFAYPADSKSVYKKFNWNNTDPAFEGGFGRQVLGETWITHHAPNGSTSTRAVFAPGSSGNPILRGIADGEIWGTTGVYGIRLPMLENCKPLLLGQVVNGPKPTDKPTEGKLNDPMMPIAWTRTYAIVPGKTGRAFCTTMGSASDLKSETLRRLMVNACYWAVGLEDKIAEKANAELVQPAIDFKRGVKPSDLHP